MLSSMNTIAFAEEVAVDEAEAVLETADVVAEDAAVADVDAELSDYVHFNDKVEPITEVTYVTDSTNKKATLKDIATITNTDDPVSWNNYYAEDCLYSVLYGFDGETGSLNNSKPLSVSQSAATFGGVEIKGLRKNSDYNGGSVKYEVVTIEDGKAYLLVGYSLRNSGVLDDAVPGHNDFTVEADGWKFQEEIPTIVYDGRAIDFNKSGIHKYAANKKEALDVKVALVKYENGTVTELPGVAVTAKVDKNAKEASLTADYTEREVKVKQGETELPYTVYDRTSLGDLPSFTITVKAKGNDAKPYAKDLKEKLKDKKFYFGVIQGTVSVGDPTWSKAPAGSRGAYNDHIGNGKTISSNEEIEAVEKQIETIMNHDASLDFDSDEWDLGALTISKFNGTKATLASEFGDLGDDKKGHNKEGKVTLKQKTDYDFKEGTLAGEKVQVLEFTGNNWVYDPTDRLVKAGYKWAFRMTPVEKAKTFRYGIYKDTNNGFVFSTED